MVMSPSPWGRSRVWLSGRVWVQHAQGPGFKPWHKFLWERASRLMTILNSNKKYNLFNAHAHVQTALPRAQWTMNTARYIIQCVHGWVHIPLNISTPTSAWRRLASPSPLDQFPSMRIDGDGKILCSYLWQNAFPYISSPLVHTFAVCSWHSPTARRRGGACLVFLDYGRDSG